MKRSMIIPAAVALSVHAWLLFGFTQSPTVAAMPQKPEPSREPLVIIPVEDPPPEENVAAGGGSSEPRALPPMQPDLPVSNPSADAITMPLNPAPARINTDDRLVTGPIDYSGIGGGVGTGLGQTGSVIDASLLDKEPRTRVQPAPVYPFDMRRNGQGGQVMVAFTVDETGRVVNPRVLSSSAREFEEPTLRAVEKWRFEPGKRNGRPVRFKMVVPVGFNVGLD